MILFENSLIKLNYDPATDILVVEHPDLHDFLLVEIKHNIDILVENTRNYDVKKFLLDSSRTVISVGEAESRDITNYMASGLMKTRIQKVARVQSPSQAVEMNAQKNIRHVHEAWSLPFEVQNFTSRAKAIEWLMK